MRLLLGRLIYPMKWAFADSRFTPTRGCTRDTSATIHGQLRAKENLAAMRDEWQ
jgi:hypothetical protein